MRDMGKASSAYVVVARETFVAVVVFSASLVASPSSSTGTGEGLLGLIAWVDRIMT
jgi:hypothetical protein